MYLFRISLIAILAFTASTAFSATPAKPDNQDNKSSKFNILDCKQLSWMKNCTQINKAAREKPGTHLRVFTKDGHDLNFPPGTPSAMINFMVERTPASAKKLADYMERDEDIREQAARLWQAEMIRRKGLKGGLSVTDLYIQSEPRTINYKDLNVYIFYESTCPACRIEMPQIASLKQAHPNLKLSVIQVDQSISGVKKVNRMYDLNAHIASEQQLVGLRSEIKAYPTIWIQNNRTHKKVVINKFLPQIKIESNLERMSQ